MFFFFIIGNLLPLKQKFRDKIFASKYIPGFLRNTIGVDQMDLRQIIVFLSIQASLMAKNIQIYRMWISQTNGRKLGKQNSLDKIKQYLKLTEKSSYTSSLVKVPPFTSNIEQLQEKKTSHQKQNSSNLRQIKQSLRQTKIFKPHSTVFSGAINLSKSQAIDDNKSQKVTLSSFVFKQKVKSQIKSSFLGQNEKQPPYYLQCLSKKHRLLGEMNIHLQNSIMFFKEFLKHCEGKKYQSAINERLSLEEKTEFGKDRKVIVFDMDETLIHTDESITPDFQIRVPFKAFHGKVSYGFVNVRPYAKQLLQRLNEYFDIIVFTASSQGYADPILDHIDPHKVIQKRYYREHCTLIKNQVYVKDLRVLGKRLQNVVLVDNAPYSYMMQIHNGIPILPYYRGKEDDQLRKLERYLMCLKDLKDVRVKNKEYFSLNEYMKYDSYEKVVQNVYGKWQAKLK